MDNKQEYLVPEAELIYLNLESPILDASVDATGANVTWGTETGFDDFFLVP